jgi:hypothetical protein
LIHIHAIIKIQRTKKIDISKFFGDTFGPKMNEKMPINMHRQPTATTVTLRTSPAKMLRRILSAATTTAATTKVFVTLFILLRICTISSNAVLAAKVSAVNVDKPTGQRFAMEPQDQTAIVGSRVTLPCRVVDKVGKLQVSFVWPPTVSR